MRTNALLGIALLSLTLHAQQPPTEWARALGAGGYDNSGRSVAIDNAGDIYVAGAVGGATIDLDPGPAVIVDSVQSGCVPLIMKLDKNGNYLWGGSFKHIGTPDWSQASVVHADGAGNVYVGGYFRGTMDFDPGPGTFTLNSANSAAGFVVKLSSNGTFKWAHAFDYVIEAGMMDSDPSGLYLAGAFMGTSDFDPGPGTFTASSVGSMDGFFLKLDNNGNFVFAKRITGNYLDYFTGIRVHPDGSLYLSGCVQDSCDLDPGAGVFTAASTQYSITGFIAHYDMSGNFLSAGVFQGGASRINDLDIDANGRVLAAGGFYGSVDFDFSDGSSVLYGQTPLAQQGFLAVYDAGGNLQWTKAIGVGFTSRGLGIWSVDSDPAGNIACVGNFYGNLDVDPGPGSDTIRSSGPDMFVMRLSAAGNYQWAFSFGSLYDRGMHNPDDWVYDVATGPDGEIYTTGRCTYTTDFNPGPSTQVISYADNDLFVMKLHGDLNTVVETPRGIEHFEVFPNPTSGIMSLKGGDISKLTVTDLLGNDIHLPMAENRIDISLLPAGVYLLTIEGQNGRLTTKVIRE